MLLYYKLHYSSNIGTNVTRCDLQIDHKLNVLCYNYRPFGDGSRLSAQICPFISSSCAVENRHILVTLVY